MKFDAAFNSIFSYTAALSASAAAAQSIAPATSPSIFWPAFGGAAASALLTIKPAFQGKSQDAPRDVAFLAFITLTVGFLFSFFASPYLNEVRFLGMIGPTQWPPQFAAFIYAVAGERLLSVAWSKTPAEWLAIITRQKLGGDK